MLVHQNSHDLGDRNGRMRVVELNGGLVGERVERTEFVAVAAHEVLQRRRGEEIFLPQAKLLALRRIVVGIKEAGDGFGARPIRARSDMVALIERLKVDGIGGAGRPQA